MGTEEMTDRRAHLRRLDDILEALEQLNLSEAAELPERVVRSLAAHDIPVEDGVEIRVLIERVWRKQESHMLSPRQERRRSSSRRAHSRRPPGHDVIESILRQGGRGPAPGMGGSAE
jgi:hypothetical protein